MYVHSHAHLHIHALTRVESRWRILTSVLVSHWKSSYVGLARLRRIVFSNEYTSVLMGKTTYLFVWYFMLSSQILGTKTPWKHGMIFYWRILMIIFIFQLSKEFSFVILEEFILSILIYSRLVLLFLIIRLCYDILF